MRRECRGRVQPFSLNLHAVWCPKFRRKVLTVTYDLRVNEIIAEIAAHRDVSVHALEVMPNHVRLFLGFVPRAGRSRPGRSRSVCRPAIAAKPWIAMRRQR
ncbi:MULTISPECIES: transposase [unclassified Methylobacterium]|jgi:putative transposase|uniref:transposase n=1 Tax=unclassified Methylobacterium TaxID=2615210 RepID=UPI0008E5D349|nr:MULTISPECIES: transposase [unclassified Methylobacterium]SFU97625.1 Transposase IS200 like [Methylobacterium sp. UNCCL125]